MKLVLLTIFATVFFVGCSSKQNSFKPGYTYRIHWEGYDYLNEQTENKAVFFFNYVWADQGLSGLLMCCSEIAKLPDGSTVNVVMDQVTELCGGPGYSLPFSYDHNPWDVLEAIAENKNIELIYLEEDN